MVTMWSSLITQNAMAENMASCAAQAEQIRELRLMTESLMKRLEKAEKQNLEAIKAAADTKKSCDAAAVVAAKKDKE